ncbi:hypothetical protein AX15_006187 [Amanita polypyramis BW_CC]|nr:hypothetical protein AX15_006187 [Amanita polypyramis BW_CC]
MNKTGGSTQFIEFVKELLLPTSSTRFQAIAANVKESYSGDIKALEQDRDTLRHLMLASRAKRVDVLDDLRRTLPADFYSMVHGRQIEKFEDSIYLLDTAKRTSTLISGVEPLTAHQEKLTEVYLHHVRATRQLREHLKEVEEDLGNFKHTVDSQAVAEFTKYYRGLRDWGESMRYYFGTFATGLATLSLAGAGLVYSTIFGATRGDVGLMSFTFPLFTVGFLVPGFIHIGMCWASNVPRGLVFASQRFWTFGIILALIVATNMVIAAIVIVNTTIFFLDPNSPGPRKTSTLGEVAGIISLAFSGSIIVTSVAALLLGLFSHKLGASLAKYRAQVFYRESNALNNYDHV